MNILFWVLWVSELLGVCWWLYGEMKSTYRQPNPFVFLSLLYLLAVLGIRFGLGILKLSMGMVVIPAIPLLFLVLVVIIASTTRGRMN
jgi:hypothetical protein